MIFKIAAIMVILSGFITMYFLKNKNPDTTDSKKETFPAMVDYGSHG
jgi:hypothetical protein